MRLSPFIALTLTLVACGKGPQSASPEAPVVADSAVATGELAAIEVTNAWVRAPLPPAPVAGGYLTLRNPGTVDRQLVAVETGAAERVEIHEMRTEDGMMRMRQLTEGLPLPAGETVTLAPGGLHLMLIAPGEEVGAGSSVELTLRFANGPSQVVIAEVRPQTMPVEEAHDHAH